MKNINKICSTNVLHIQRDIKKDAYYKIINIPCIHFFLGFSFKMERNSLISVSDKESSSTN